MEEQLWRACSEGKVEEVIKQLQNEQINTNWQYNILKTPLNENGEEGENVLANYLGWTPLLISCEKGHIEIVKILLNDKRVSIRRKIEGKTAIDIAKEENHSIIVKIIKEFDTGNLLNDY